jgi:hypothetical protein
MRRGVFWQRRQLRIYNAQILFRRHWMHPPIRLPAESAFGKLVLLLFLADIQDGVFVAGAPTVGGSEKVHRADIQSTVLNSDRSRET